MKKIKCLFNTLIVNTNFIFMCVNYALRRSFNNNWINIKFIIVSLEGF